MKEVMALTVGHLVLMEPTVLRGVGGEEVAELERRGQLLDEVRERRRARWVEGEEAEGMMAKWGELWGLHLQAGSQRQTVFAASVAARRLA